MTTNPPKPVPKGIAKLYRADSPLRTPIIQRSFAWGPRQVSDYWNDLAAALTANRYHFLGLIVIDEQGRIHDGQQRLATTYVFLQCLEEQLDRYKTRLGEQEAIDANVGTLAGNLSRVLRGEEQTPTPPVKIGKGDQTALIRTSAGLAQTTESATRLIKARGTLRDLLTVEMEALADDRARVDRLWAWWKFLNDGASIIELTVSAQTASRVFETLNTRGVQLAVDDLIKSYLLATVNETDQDEGMSAWESVAQQLGKETAVREFVLHYWGSHHGQTTKDDLFPALKKHVDGDPAAALRQLKAYEQDAGSV